ncbi:ABC transporter ATP-binding protein [Ligilactobacillus ceti]|uniref:Abc superfamily atp binding cassette transporter, abc protein n=1 Tax=Ligilactobacillus ceti DSM 22408 TaxID=1122146 RepID=A0A0R2KGL5_9LACO|nr:ABC transporter ATP-binding protein [Ligilactobacillus ceti]KRN88513.1 abc superfamily atp binding cassette transporter, abc protein [Ligilactobacillus ceti DSM 22408]
MVLNVSHLTGGYSLIPVLKDLSFEVQAGELVGLIGLNGAGKSTTINHIIGLLTPQAGEIKVDNLLLAENMQGYRKAIAYIPETPVLYPELTLKEHIEMTILAYELDEKTAWEKAHELLQLFRLEERLDWFPANFSKGMKQKVMIVCAFMLDAKLYIIDEPFVGLDPLAIRDLLQLIEQKKTQGAAILMSTHVLSTAEQTCDRFVMIDQGQLKASGTLAELQNEYQTYGDNLADIYLGLTQGA